MAKKVRGNDLEEFGPGPSLSTLPTSHRAGRQGFTSHRLATIKGRKGEGDEEGVEKIRKGVAKRSGVVRVPGSRPIILDELAASVDGGGEEADATKREGDKGEKGKEVGRSEQVGEESREGRRGGGKEEEKKRGGKKRRSRTRKEERTEEENEAKIEEAGEEKQVNMQESGGELKPISAISSLRRHVLHAGGVRHGGGGEGKDGVKVMSSPRSVTLAMAHDLTTAGKTQTVAEKKGKSLSARLKQGEFKPSPHVSPLSHSNMGKAGRGGGGVGVSPLSSLDLGEMSDVEEALDRQKQVAEPSHLTSSPHCRRSGERGGEGRGRERERGGERGKKNEKRARERHGGAATRSLHEGSGSDEEVQRYAGQHHAHSDKLWSDAVEIALGVHQSGGGEGSEEEYEGGYEEGRIDRIEEWREEGSHNARKDKNAGEKGRGAKQRGRGGGMQEEEYVEEVELVECRVCRRSFFSHRISKHTSVCERRKEKEEERAKEKGRQMQKRLQQRYGRPLTSPAASQAKKGSERAALFDSARQRVYSDGRGVMAGSAPAMRTVLVHQRTRKEVMHTFSGDALRTRLKHERRRTPVVRRSTLRTPLSALPSTSRSDPVVLAVRTISRREERKRADLRERMRHFHRTVARGYSRSLWRRKSKAGLPALSKSLEIGGGGGAAGRYAREQIV
uniref:C2HC/C3H-type domain-containing protein n=1 Tax=Palpitomonas bilix TaxID=652834 RepID=A0A7S3CV91_9EUKA